MPLLIGQGVACLNRVNGEATVKEQLLEARPSLKLLLLLVGHTAESLNAQEERLTTSSLFLTRLHLPHTVGVMSHVRKVNAGIPTPEAAGSIGV